MCLPAARACACPPRVPVLAHRTRLCLPTARACACPPHAPVLARHTRLCLPAALACACQPHAPETKLWLHAPETKLCPHAPDHRRTPHAPGHELALSFGAGRYKREPSKGLPAMSDQPEHAPRVPDPELASRFARNDRQTRSRSGV
eukprot:366383-Chlamydomonas_euryale.AAC.11